MLNIVVHKTTAQNFTHIGKPRRVGMPLCLDQTDSRLVFTFSASIKLPSNVYKGIGGN